MKSEISKYLYTRTCLEPDELRQELYIVVLHTHSDVIIQITPVCHKQ